MTQLVGLTPAGTLRAGDKLRATWTFLGASWLPSFLNDAPGRARDIQLRLPSLGFVPLSQPSAIDGDEVIVFDLQLSQSWGAGVATSAIVDKLDHVGSGLQAYYDLNLTRLERISTSSSVDLQKQRDDARTQGNTEANTNALFDRIGDLIGVAGKTLALAVVVVAGVAAYVYLRKK